MAVSDPLAAVRQLRRPNRRVFPATPPGKGRYDPNPEQKDIGVTPFVLSKGQNIELPEETLQVDALISWEEPERDVDASALLLGPNRKVRSDSDFVFYNQPATDDSSVQYLGRSATESGPQERISIDLSAVPADVDVIAIAGSVGAGTFGDLGKLHLRIIDGVGGGIAEFFTADADSESAFVFGEVYRRNGRWKLRAVGQGWASGLEGLATDFGVEVDNDDDVSAGPGEGSVANETAPAAIVEPAAAPGSTAVQPQQKATRTKRGVRTTKAATKKAKLPEFKLAGSETWQPARLFSIAGIGGRDEQERRATSALIAIMQAVKPFARAICSRIGAPVGAFEGYTEVPYSKGETTVIPDGVLRVARGERLWTALLEVKTGTGQLRREQIENYLDVAKKHKYDVVITLSNDIPAGAGDLPVEVDRRKLTKVALRHLSWSDVTHEARMLLAHGDIQDGLQAWLLNELLRYLTHPRSGAVEFADMGAHWVTVRDSVSAGTLRIGDKKAAAVADRWGALSRNLALRLTADLGVPVKHVLPRRAMSDADARRTLIVDRLVADGTFHALFRIPETAGDLTVIADLRTNKIHCSTTVEAPDEGTAGRRINWLVRQLRAAPDNLQVEALFSEPGVAACEHLDLIRANPKVLTEGRTGEIISFVLRQNSPMGSKRSGTASGFVNSVTDSVDTFYEKVLQPLREWVPAAPKHNELDEPEA